MIGCESMDTVWIVTYVDNGEATPVPFDNQEAANKCYQWLKNFHEWVGLDLCEVGSTFGE